MANVDTMNQSQLEAITRNRCQARENSCAQVTIGFGFALRLSSGDEKGASFLNQSKQSQTKREISSTLN